MGFYAFGADQTIADVGKVEWQPLKLEGLPAGIEIAVLRGDLGKGGGEILLKLPANYIVPNHSHISDEAVRPAEGCLYLCLRRRQRGRDWRAGLHQLAGQHAACAQVPFRGVHLLRPPWPTVRSLCP